MDKLGYLNDAIEKLENYMNCEEEVDIAEVVKDLKCMAYDIMMDACKACKAEDVKVEEEAVGTAEPEAL